MNYPNIYLVLDNCFAIKRWVSPAEWMGLCKELGVNYVQASTDNEIDPLYCPKDYRDDWVREVKKHEQTLGMKVCNFYTGYQTYRTAGLAHDDSRVVAQLQEGWFSPMLLTAAELSAGLGFYMVALQDKDLQSPTLYRKKMGQIYTQMDLVAQKAKPLGVEVSLEQMYNPTAPPWTIRGTQEFLREVYSLSASPFYTTIDVGHMVGQMHFLRPEPLAIESALRTGAPLYVGAEETRLLLEQLQTDRNCTQEAVWMVQKSMDRFPYLFALPEDADPYSWLRELGCYSPIMHLQQTNGKTAHHAAFTNATNKDGIIDAGRVLREIAKSYETKEKEGMPPRVKNIYLSFEIFATNTESRCDILSKLKSSVELWRQWIPRDGLPLNELIG